MIATVLWWEMEHFHERGGKLDRKRLHPRQRESLSRCILFLRCGGEYKWPKLGFLGIRALLRWWRGEASGMPSLWPFFDRRDYEDALVHPPFLAGWQAS